MIELSKIDPAKNMRRFYRLSLEPTLFGDFALVREWGRIGAKGGRRQEEWYAAISDADVALIKALQRREARGYRQ
jgi:predicted DNA-binding WGR domain protein